MKKICEMLNLKDDDLSNKYVDLTILVLSVGIVVSLIILLVEVIHKF